MVPTDIAPLHEKTRGSVAGPVALKALSRCGPNSQGRKAGRSTNRAISQGEFGPQYANRQALCLTIPIPLLGRVDEVMD